MVSKRAYKRVSVNKIDRERLIDSAAEFGDVGTVLGLDIAKHEIVACLRWGRGGFERPWKIVNPIAEELLRCHRVELGCEKILKSQIFLDPIMNRYSGAVGCGTLAVLWNDVGDPIKYGSSGASTRYRVNCEAVDSIPLPQWRFEGSHERDG